MAKERVEFRKTFNAIVRKLKIESPRRMNVLREAIDKISSPNTLYNVLNFMEEKRLIRREQVNKRHTLIHLIQKNVKEYDEEFWWQRIVSQKIREETTRINAQHQLIFHDYLKNQDIDAVRFGQLFDIFKDLVEKPNVFNRAWKDLLLRKPKHPTTKRTRTQKKGNKLSS